MNYKINNQFLEVTVATKGAELQSVKDLNSKQEYLWQADPKIWGRHAPVLFPFVGRLKDDQYEYDGHTYPMGQHGFARDKEFMIADQSEDSITLSLKADSETLKIYPFDFELRVTYSLLNNLLKEEFEVINNDTKEMIFGIGGHPGFNLPVGDGIKKEDYYFEILPLKDRIRVPLKAPYLDWNGRTLSTLNTPITISDDLFKNDALVYELRGNENKVTIRNDKNNYHINVWTGDAPFVGVWSQYPNTADYVCIEPWWGIADTLDSDGKLEDKRGMNRLAAGANWHDGFEIAFHS